MRPHNYIYELPEEEHASALLQGELLAEAHEEYAVVVNDVKKAVDQAAEIDVLLAWKYRLTHDENGDFINHDTKITTTKGVYNFTPEESGYAGSLGDEGEQTNYRLAAEGSTMFDLYMEVLQLLAYKLYNIPAVVPISACDAENPCSVCGWASCKNCPHKH